MDPEDSQAVLEEEASLQALAEELGLDPDEYTLEQLRVLAAREGSDVFGNLRTKDDEESGDDGTAAELPPEDEDNGGDEADSGDDSGSDDESGDEDDGDDDENYVWF
jgi:hypothetical protein